MHNADSAHERYDGFEAELVNEFLDVDDAPPVDKDEHDDFNAIDVAKELETSGNGSDDEPDGEDRRDASSGDESNVDSIQRAPEEDTETKDPEIKASGLEFAQIGASMNDEFEIGEPSAHFPIADPKPPVPDDAEEKEDSAIVVGSDSNVVDPVVAPEPEIGFVPPLIISSDSVDAEETPEPEGVETVDEDAEAPEAETEPDEIDLDATEESAQVVDEAPEPEVVETVDEDAEAPETESEPGEIDLDATEESAQTVDETAEPEVVETVDEVATESEPGEIDLDATEESAQVVDEAPEPEVVETVDEVAETAEIEEVKQEETKEERPRFTYSFGGFTLNSPVRPAVHEEPEPEPIETPVAEEPTPEPEPTETPVAEEPTPEPEPTEEPVAEEPTPEPEPTEEPVAEEPTPKPEPEPQRFVYTFGGLNQGLRAPVRRATTSEPQEVADDPPEQKRVDETTELEPEAQEPFEPEKPVQINPSRASFSIADHAPLVFNTPERHASEVSVDSKSEPDKDAGTDGVSLPNRSPFVVRGANDREAKIQIARTDKDVATESETTTKPEPADKPTRPATAAKPAGAAKPATAAKSAGAAKSPKLRPTTKTEPKEEEEKEPEPVLELVPPPEAELREMLLNSPKPVKSAEEEEFERQFAADFNHTLNSAGEQKIEPRRKEYLPDVGAPMPEIPQKPTKSEPATPPEEEEEPEPRAKKPGFFSRLFGKKNR